MDLSIVNASAIQFVHVSLHFLFDSVAVQTGQSGIWQVSTLAHAIFFCKYIAYFCPVQGNSAERLDALIKRLFVVVFKYEF